MKWKLTIKLLLLLFCYFDISAVVCSNVCNVNEVAVRNLSTGTIKCYHCPNCPLGYGLAVLCGSTITNLTLRRCVHCKKGINYSDTHDYSMCQSCRHCHPHQEKTGQCTPEKDETVCGKCQSGYYEEVTGGKCEECTWCCKGNENQRRMPECIQAGLAENKQCAKSALSESCKPKEEPKFPLVKVAVGVTFGVIILLVVFLVLCRRTREKLKSSFTQLQLWVRSRNNPPEQQKSDQQHSNGNTNHESVMSRQENESEADTSVPASTSPNGSGNMHKHSTPRFDRGHSHPGYPIKSSNMFGTIPKPLIRIKEIIKKQNGFEKFFNEEGDDNLSASDPVERYNAPKGDYHRAVSVDGVDSRNKQKRLPPKNGQISDQRPFVEKFNNERDDANLSASDPWESYGAPNGDCHRTVSFGHSSSERVGCPEGLRVESGNKQKYLPPGNGHVSEPRSSVWIQDERENQPVASAASFTASHNWKRTKHAREVEKVLQDLKASQRFSDSRLCERASYIPFDILRKLCPTMNIFRHSQYDDFRMMAEYMGIDKIFIESAGQGTNPTETLLQQFDSRFGGTVGHVMAILIIINRNDAFSILERYCLKPVNTSML